MQTLVVYDIPNDRARARIADVCQDYGLDRIQYSAFLGNLQRTLQEELLKKIGKQLGKRPGKIQLFTICEKDWRLKLEIIQEGREEEEKEPRTQETPGKDTGALQEEHGDHRAADVHSE